MKRLMLPVDMIAWFDHGGGLHPIRFRLPDENGDQPRVIAIDRVQELKTEKFGGNPMRVFDCAGHIGGEQRRFQLKYEVRSCLWYLEKL